MYVFLVSIVQKSMSPKILAGSLALPKPGTQGTGKPKEPGPLPMENHLANGKPIPTTHHLVLSSDRCCYFLAFLFLYFSIFRVYLQECRGME